MKFLLLAALLFQGKFSGRGLAVTQKRTRVCEEVFLNFQQTPTQLKILDGGYHCGDLSASFDPFTLDVKDGHIFSDGAEVGTISETLVDLRYAGDDYTYHWRQELRAGGLDYLEEWTSGGKPALTVKGRLSSL